MTLKQLQVFMAIADTGSFSKGGEAVSLAQSTASQHIHALEDEFGARLFDRSASRVTLTEAGRLFYEHAARICGQCGEAITAIKRFQGLEQATLRVGASTIPAACLIPDLLGSFSAARPGVRLEVLQGDTREVIRLLQDEAVELAVVGGRFDADTICYEEVGAERIVLVAQPGVFSEAVVAIQQLQEMPLLMREPGSGTRLAVDGALQKGGLDLRCLRVVAQLGSSEALRRAVLSGAGCAFLSSMAVGRELADGTLKTVDIAGIEISRSFYLAWRRGRSFSPAAEVFMEAVRLHQGLVGRSAPIQADQAA
ncbi:MAG: selenium metabolism-associated LysR family transcriptional regulator [Desulfuromonadaceae bacterium]|nr:selenium metabolism-associated LysR family transcriptional regulator [Desulfuromonadaceae bacterium]